MPAGQNGTYRDSIERLKSFEQAMGSLNRKPSPPPKPKKSVSRVMTPDELLGQPGKKLATKKK